jgi:hypothetical protein
MKIIKDKKGFLLGEETVKIVIAVICIVFLIALLVVIYFAVSGSQEKKEAAASINITKNEIKRVDAGGEAIATGTLIPNPGGWYLFSFVDGDKKPNLCAGENCVCLCPADWFTQIRTCDSKGACYALENLKKFDTLKIDKGGTFVLIQKINGFIYISKI